MTLSLVIRPKASKGSDDSDSNPTSLRSWSLRRRLLLALARPHNPTLTPTPTLTLTLTLSLTPSVTRAPTQPPALFQCPRPHPSQVCYFHRIGWPFLLFVLDRQLHHQTYHKGPVVQRALRLAPRWLFFADADTLVTRPDVPLTNFTDDRYDVIMNGEARLSSPGLDPHVTPSAMPMWNFG